MNILILGSEGFIGRHCVKFFLEKGYEVHGCDLIDYPSNAYSYLKISRLNPSFEDAFYNIQYDACINAAGNGSVPVSIEHPLTDYEANCTDVISLLELIRKNNKHCKYIHISSAAVYGNPVRLPVREDDRLLPLSPYGWHKSISETICREYNSLYNIPVSIVRPFSIYGPGLHKQLFWDIYQKSLQSTSLNLFGTGAESRDFIFIDDLIIALDVVLNKSPLHAEVYNLANGIETTISNVVNMFLTRLNPGSKVTFNNKVRKGDPLNWRADITKIRALGFEPKTSLDSGIEKLVEWLKK